MTVEELEAEVVVHCIRFANAGGEVVFKDGGT